MKKILSGLLVSLFLWQTLITSAATDDCRQYAYGYMSDGKVYMMLAGKKYGPFEDVNQLKFTLERMGPQFKESIRQYMLYNQNGWPDKYVVFREDLGDCNPYVLDMDTVAIWNTKVTALFMRLNDRFKTDSFSYRIALTNALAKVEAKISDAKWSIKTLEILKLIRDRFSAKLRTL